MQDYQNQFGQTQAGKMAYIMNFLPGLAGLGGSSSSSGKGSSSGFGVGVIAQLGKSGI